MTAEVLYWMLNLSKELDAHQIASVLAESGGQCNVDFLSFVALPAS
jgi:hypothetical protein